MALDSFIFGGNTGLTYEQLKRRRAVAAALASQRRGFPKTVGEGMTYLGESIGDMIAERRLDAAERGSAAYGANLRREIEGGGGAPAPPPTAPLAIPPAAPRPPTPVRPPVAPVSPRPAPPASAAAPMPVLPSGPSAEAMTSGPPPSEFAMGGILNAAPLAEEGAPGQILPSSGYLPPAALATAPPSTLPAPAAVPPANAMDTAAEWPAGAVNAPPTSELQPIETPRRMPEPVAPGPQSSVPPPDAGDTPPNVLAQAQQVALQGGPAAVSRFMADAGYPKSGAWCGQFAAAVASSAGVQPPAGPAVASNWRNIGAPADTPQVGDVAIARPGWAPRRGSGETGQTGSHVTFVNQADPTGTFQGLGGNQGNMVKPFNARDFEFRRLPGDVQGHRIVGIPGEEPPPTQLAAYAPAGGVSDAPIPGMGGAGAMPIRPRPQIWDVPPPDEQVTPTDIEPMPSTAQFGPPVGQFTRSDAPVAGLPSATAAPPPGIGAIPATGTLPAPAAPPVIPGSRPSQEPIPPATPQTMEPPSATPPDSPRPRPRTAAQQKILQALGDPRLDPNGPDATLLKDRFAQDEAERQRQEKIDLSDYTSKRERWEKQTTDYEKFVREKAERDIKQQTERVALEKTISDLEKARYEATTPREQERIKNELEIAKRQRELAEGKPLTEMQAKGAQFVLRVRSDLDTVDTQLDRGKILTNGTQATLNMTPGVGNYLVSDQYRRARDALGNWGAGFMSHVSGAAITPSEAERQLPAFIPRPGDTDKDLDDKARRRREFTDAVEKASDPAGLQKIRDALDKVNNDYMFDKEAVKPPVQTRSLDELKTLPPGTHVILPDGQPGQVPRRKR